VVCAVQIKKGNNPCATLRPAAAVAQVVNKAIAAELIFVATTNFDQVRALGSAGSMLQFVLLTWLVVMHLL
jgi:hypothetical protein